MSIELKYSTGRLEGTTWDGQSSNCRGGVMSDTNVVKGVGMLFGTIAQKDLTDTFNNANYRCVYIHNTSKKELRNLRLFVKEMPFTDLTSYFIDKPNIAKFENYEINGWNTDKLWIFGADGWFYMYLSEDDMFLNRSIAKFEAVVGRQKIYPNEFSDLTISGTIDVVSLDIEYEHTVIIERKEIETGFNPELLNPQPIPRQRYIVPQKASGAWTDKDGYIAIWTGSKWVFDFQRLFDFSFAVDTAKTAQILNDVFASPFGVEFQSADSIDNGVTNYLEIGTLLAGESKPLWIKQEFKQYILTERDFASIDFEINRNLAFNQSVDINIIGDEISAYFVEKIDKDEKIVVDTEKNINFAIRLNEVGEIDYQNVSLQFKVDYLGVADLTNSELVCVFEGREYSNPQLNGNVGLFKTSPTMDLPIVLNVLFHKVGIYDIHIDLIETTTYSTISQNVFRFEATY